MIKMVYCVKRRSDISQVEFRRYWLEEHGRLVRKFASTIKIRRYVQSHTIGTETNELLKISKGTSEPYDGIAEIWWDSWEGFAAAASPEGIAADQILMEDEKKFIDHSLSSVFFTEEYEILDLR